MAGFLKKIWKPRIVEYPGRRRLDDTSQPEVYDVSRAEGNIIQQGDGFTADNMNNLEERIFSGFDNAEKVISDEFSTEKTYSSGEYAIYNNTLYRFTAAKPAGAWDASKVQAMTVAGALRELNANIGKKQDASTAITTGNIGQQSVKHATTAGSANAVAWGNVSGKPGTYPPSGHNHDDRYYTETEVNAKINNLKKVELILSYSDLTSSTKTFALSKNWASFKYVWVGLACNSDNVFLWKSGLIIPTEMLKIAHGNYQVSCIYDLTDFYVNAEVDFSNANHINSRITSHGSDAGFSNARIYVFGLEEP